MKKFLTALQFLTSIPAGDRTVVSDRQLAGSMAYFSFVGLLIGAVLALSYNLLSLIFPHSVSCAFILVFNIILTGGLHTDGFIDTFDAIASGSGAKRMLEIMREGRPGAIGVASAILLFLVKYSLLISFSKADIWAPLILMTVLGRWSLVLSAGLYPYARQGEGLGRKFIQDLKIGEVLSATAMAFAIAFLILNFRAFILMPLACCGALLFNLYMFKKIGGITGDTLGALNELVEVLALSVILVLLS
ncbi:MAG: adenosylcobinamide-GDP ribazoletransferase [Candidatus Omnitrophota bacterium]